MLIQRNAAVMAPWGFLAMVGACFLFFPSGPAMADPTTFYVAPTGNDENPGSESEPFATLERARDAVRKHNKTMDDDITIVLRGGTYRLKRTLVFDPQDSGHHGHHVIYKASPGEKPVLSGGVPITGWKADVDGRWKARCDEHFRQLYVDGKRAVRARSPESKTDDPAHWTQCGIAYMPGVELFGEQGYRTTEVAMADWRNPGDIEICYYVGWCHTRCKVESITRDGDHALIRMVQPQFMLARNKEGVRVSLPHYLENALELLDEPGEWYLDRSAKVLYYKPRPGENMETAEVIAPLLEKLVELRGSLEKPVEHIHFQGITFRHATWLEPSRVGVVEQQANFQQQIINRLDRMGHVCNVHNEVLKSPANVICRTAKHLRFEGCVFSQLGGAGIDLEYGSQENVITGCHFRDISGSAIQIGDVQRSDHHPGDERTIVKNNHVVGNLIEDCAVEYMGGVGIFVGYTDGTRIAHNEIRDLPYSGISMGWGWGEEDAGGGFEGYYQPYKFKTPTPSGNNRVEYNHIHHVMSKLQDGGGIYTLGNMPGTMIRENHIHDNPGVPGGVYLDEGSGFIEVTGNVVHGVSNWKACNNHHQNRIATCKIHDNWSNWRPGAESRAPGKVGKALLCDGMGNCVSVPHEDKLDPKNLSVEAWIQLSAYPVGKEPRRWIVNKNCHEFTAGHYALIIDGKKVAGYLNIGGGQANYHEAYSDELLKLNHWHHLAMTYDGETMRVYLDGREVASKQVGKERSPGNTSLDIGRRQDGHVYFTGKIDEVRLYDRALEPREVQANAAATGSSDSQNAIVQQGLVGYWGFEDTPTIPRQVQEVIDHAGLLPRHRDLMKHE